ncbi:MAG: DUF481 domain-containing protein [Myxococcota bacterium]
MGYASGRAAFGLLALTIAFLAFAAKPSFVGAQDAKQGQDGEPREGQEGAEDGTKEDSPESQPDASDQGAEDSPPDSADVLEEGAEVPSELAEEGADAATVDPTDVPDEGVPDAPVDADKALEEVEKAVKVVTKESEEGLPDEYTIEFGDTFDWVRLTSGEWLKGEFRWMRDKDFEFDSNDLDIITKEWEKVDQLHAPRVHTYAFTDDSDIVGRAVVTKDQVLIETVDGVITRPRSELLAIVDGGRRERDWWYVRLGAGFSGSLGNTNQSSLTSNFELGRADTRTVSKVTYEGTVGYADREEVVNRHLGGVDVRVYLSHRFYVVPFTAEFFNDRFANIRLRANPGAAGGVHLFDTDKVEWDLEVGFGYQFLRIIGTVEGIDNPQNDAFIGLRSDWDLDLTSILNFELEWQTYLVVTTIGNTSHQGTAKVSIEFSDIFNFDVSFLFFRTEQPLPRSDGTVPQKNDYQLIIGVSLEIG